VRTYSSLVGRVVETQSGRQLGKARDLRATIGSSRPTVEAIVVGRRGRFEHLGIGKLAHTLSVNEFCTLIAEEARPRGDEFTSEDWRNEVALRIPKRGPLIADAFFCYREADGGHAYRFLEWDSGSMPIAEVGLKVERYRDLFASKAAWQNEYRVFPKVTFVLGGRRAQDRLQALLGEANRMRLLYHGLSSSSSDLHFLATTEQELEREGPFGRIWWWAEPRGEVLRGFLNRPDRDWGVRSRP